MMARYLLLVAAVAVAHALVEAADTKTKTEPDARLGLLASALGVPPVPGASYGGANAGAQSTSYTGGNIPGGGDSYGPPPGPSPIKACRCTPKAYCLDPGASAGVLQPPGPNTPGYNNGGGTSGGNGGSGGDGTSYTGGGNGGGNGGNVVPGYGGNGGSGGNVPVSPGYGGSGGSGGNVPVSPGYGGSGGNGGGAPGPSYGGLGDGKNPPGYGGNGGSGGNGGGLVEPGYGGNGGGLIEGGTDHGLQPGYGGDGQGTDGAGVIDIRIVNKPPGGNVACIAGEVYCCNRGDGGSQGGNGGSYVDPNGGGSHGGNGGSYVDPNGGGSQGGNGPYPSSPGTCGVRQIIPVPGFKPEYGQSQFGSYPWMVVILGPNNNYIGAGALLDNYNVLTAAHKIAEYKGNFKIRLGEWNAQADDEPFKNVEVDVARVDIHPAFNSQNLQNDVAIIKLAQPVSLDAYPHIKSACLPTHGASFVGSRCWVAGFGKDAFQTGKHSYILREVDVPIIDSNECEQRLRGTRLGNYFNLNRKSFLCAGGEEGKDACTGDGGSPLVCEYNGKFNVVGLVAWGIGCAEYGIPGVYVNVGNYVNWIQGQLYQSQDQDLAGYARAKPTPVPAPAPAPVKSY